jgi:hypothetical protein
VNLAITARLLFLLCLATPATAYAYLDPGTGSILLQGLIAAVAVGLGIGKMYWAKLKAFFKGEVATKPPAGPGEGSA